VTPFGGTRKLCNAWMDRSSTVRGGGCEGGAATTAETGAWITVKPAVNTYL